MPAGRPLMFQNVEELSASIDRYFQQTPEDEWTWTGLALYLDCDKETLSSYRDGEGDRKEFSGPVKKAMLKVESSYEKDLKKSGRPGTIFALKNFKWVDKVENEMYGKGGAPLIPKPIMDLTTPVPTVAPTPSVSENNSNQAGPVAEEED